MEKLLPCVYTQYIFGYVMCWEDFPNEIRELENSFLQVCKSGGFKAVRIRKLLRFDVCLIFLYFILCKFETKTRQKVWMLGLQNIKTSFFVLTQLKGMKPSGICSVVSSSFSLISWFLFTYFFAKMRTNNPLSELVCEKNWEFK